MNLENIKVITANCLRSVLNENNISDIVITDDLNIFGPKSIIDSLQLINLIVKIEEEIINKYDKEIIIVDDESIVVGDSPFATIESLSEYVLKKFNSS
tara:strand:- start:653 stop:946 length:294 start_codon:yes stop_codon:yes gene_type:complete